MELVRMIKSDARRAMRFCGGRAVASVLVAAMACLIITVTESVLLLVFCGTKALYFDVYTLAKISPEALYILLGSSVFWFLLVPALLLGLTKLYLSFAEGKDESIITLFDMFSSFKKFIGSVFFAVSFAVRYIFVFAAAIFPGGAFLWFSKTYIPEETRTAQLLKISACCIAITIMILCVFLAIIFVQRWSLAIYYRAEGFGIQKSFSVSAKAAKCLCTRILSFKCSFIGWGILSVFILPAIWAVPYYGLSNAIFAKYLMERYEHSLAKVPETVSANVTFEETY